MNPSSLPGASAKLNNPFTFSQSSLQDYVDCPRRFQLRFVEQMQWPAIESEPVAEFEVRQEEGLRFHRLVQQHVLGLSGARLGQLAETPNLRLWWQNYLQADFGIKGYARRPELSLVCAVGSHRLVAKYDLIAVLDGEIVIFDWKTSARRPSDEWLAARWQTRIYPALVARAGAAVNRGQPPDPQNIRMIYWFAEFPNQPAQFRYDAEQFRRDWAAASGLIQEITAATSFPMTDDLKMCRLCVYRSYCDRGGAAGTRSDAESQEQMGDEFDLNFEQVSEIEF